MATTNPPDGWTMGTGTWSTDADQETALAESGLYTLQLKNTAVATRINSDYTILTAGETYLLRAYVRADSVAAGNTVTIRHSAHNAAKSSAAVTDLVSAVLPSANVWHEYVSYITVGALHRWSQWSVYKAANAFNVYVDKLEVERCPVSFSVTKAAAQTNLDGPYEILTFDTEAHDYGGVFASNVFTAPWKGVYSFSGQCMLGSLGSAKSMQVALYKNAGLYMEGPTVSNGTGGAANTASNISCTAVPLNKGDTMGLYNYHNHGSALSSVASLTFFQGHQIL